MAVGLNFILNVSKQDTFIDIEYFFILRKFHDVIEIIDRYKLKFFFRFEKFEILCGFERMVLKEMFIFSFSSF